MANGLLRESGAQHRASDKRLECGVHGALTYVSGVRAGKFRSACSPETAGNHFATAWVGQVYGKLKRLVPQGESDPQIEQASDGRKLAVVQKESMVLIERYLASQEIGKSRKRPEVELDLDAQIAGMLAGMKVDLHTGLATGSSTTPKISHASEGHLDKYLSAHLHD